MEERSLESSFRVVSLAKLDPVSLQPQCQAIRFAASQEEPEQSNDKLTLMEVTSEVADQLEQGIPFVFRGDANDWVMLASPTAVYDIKEAETSNSLLLVKDILDNDHCKEELNENNIALNAHQVKVLKTFFRYLEMKPTKPAWQKLYKLLGMWPNVQLGSNCKQTAVIFFTKNENKQLSSFHKM